MSEAIQFAMGFLLIFGGVPLCWALALWIWVKVCRENVR